MLSWALAHVGLLGGIGAAGLSVASLMFPGVADAILKLVAAILKLPKPVFIAASSVLAFLWMRAEGDSRHWHKQSDRYETLYNQEHNGRVTDRKTYLNAQTDAAAANKAQVVRVKQQQQEITSDVEAHYRADLARLHAERGNVQPSNATPQSSPGGSGAGNTSPAPSGPDHQAVPLSGPELLQARETELQLNALIDWVLGQSKVDPNKP